jgi:dolichyl-phosphate-mannose-protein mannosyltransferase
MTAPSSLLRAHPLSRVLTVLAALAVLEYVVVALLRLRYPFEIEWIEGGSLAMARRVAAGLPLYTAPGLDYVPFNYTPLYFVVSGLALEVFGGGFATLRAVSLLSSLACGALIYAQVRRETRDGLPSWLAAGLFFACFRHAGAWMDVARSDSLHLALLLAGGWVLRADRSAWRGGAAAGLLLTLSFLAKQSALVAAVPMLAGATLFQPRRAVAFAATVVVAVAGSTLMLDAATHGWFRYYVFALAGRYPFDVGRVASFWTRDLFGPLAFAAVAGLYAWLAPPGEGDDPEEARGRRVTWGLIAGLVLSSWAVRAFPASYENVLLAACAGLAIAFGLGWNAVARTLDHAAPEARRPLATFVAMLGIAQFALLIWNPMKQLPGPDDASMGARLVDALRRSPGEVLVPCHDFISVRAGKRPHFHEMAFIAVVKSSTGERETALMDELRRALSEHRWATIVLDKADWLWDEVEVYYQPLTSVFPSEDVCWPLTGMHRRPEVIFVPKPGSAGLTAPRR